MEMNLGSKAATQQSWDREITIRAIIKEIQDENPRASEKRLVQLLTDRMRDDDDALIAAAEYAVKNAIGAQQNYASRARYSPTPQQRAQREAEIEKAAKAGAAQILFLNFIQPNGKATRFCSGDYIAKLGGGWVKVGKKAGKKLVGQVFDEAALRKCMGI